MYSFFFPFGNAAYSNLQVSFGYADVLEGRFYAVKIT